MFKLFKSKKQEETITSINPGGPATATKPVSRELTLSVLRIEYNVSQTTPFHATIRYEERPTNWSDHGITEEVVIKGENWSDLLEKVSKHFVEV